MMTHSSVTEIEALAADAGVKVKQLFETAEVAFSNWSRWKNKKTSPNTSTVEKLKKAAEKISVPKDVHKRPNKKVKKSETN